MGEKDQGRLEFLQSLIVDLKKIEGDQQVIIQHIAKVQGDLQNEGKETIASKIGEIFSNASKNTDLLHEIINEYQMEINKLKAGG
ncbi:MAG: hypothetical protein P9M12_01575 [Candidatus Aceula lacicola]|nr:hypothetical protein [Candidatus Aceula lacicola]